VTADAIVRRRTATTRGGDSPAEAPARTIRRLSRVTTRKLTLRANNTARKGSGNRLARRACGRCDVHLPTRPAFKNRTIKKRKQTRQGKGRTLQKSGPSGRTRQAGSRPGLRRTREPVGAWGFLAGWNAGGGYRRRGKEPPRRFLTKDQITPGPADQLGHWGIPSGRATRQRLRRQREFRENVGAGRPASQLRA